MADEIARELQAFDLVGCEMQRQDAKWGADRDLDDYVWLAILTEEVGEAAESVLKEQGPHTLEEAVQAAAVAVQWVKCLLRKYAPVAAEKGDEA